MKKLIHNSLKNYLRYFPLQKGKTRIFTAFWKPLSFGNYHRETTLLQADVRLHCDLTKFLQRNLYFFGGYEKELCDLWIALARRAETIFDVGANVGLYSLLAAANNPQTKIHAFEPTPEIVESLYKNIELNGMQNIAVNSVAVGACTGTGALNRLQDADGLYDGMNFVSRKAAQTATAISVIALDSYCRQHVIERIDLMKMDIEGGEFDALQGAKRLLQEQAIDCLFIELVESHAQRSGHSTVEIKKLLLDAGYRICRLRGRRLADVPAQQAHDGDGENVIAFLPHINFSQINFSVT